MDAHSPDSLRYPLGSPPPPGTAVRVTEGVHWVRMPLPFALDHINLWLLEDGTGWTVVDTGVSSARTRDHWESIFRTVLGGRPVTRVIVTHFHPDHIGLAGWFVERWQADFCTSLTEWLFGRMLSLDTGAQNAPISEGFYRSAGLDAEAARRLAGRHAAYAQGVAPLPGRLKRLRAGDMVVTGALSWRVLIGRGHSPEQVCLHCEEQGILVAGDQVLPRISPNVSVWPSEPEADPLGDFLDSLAGLARLPDDTLVLPSHGEPFQGLRARIDALVSHHGARLEETLATCAAPSTVMEVTRGMFDRPLDDHQMMFAVGEALAHLNHLAAKGRVRRLMGMDGQLRFARS
jgi:glyoxylase-like metal-dependent hydrolase (beta-lactamase superfamily II)